MRRRSSAVVLAVLAFSSVAFAAPPSLGFGVREEVPSFSASLLLSPVSFGVGAEKYSVDPLGVRSALSAELELFGGTGVGELRGARTWHLLGRGRLRLSGMVGATGLAVLKGPVSFGIGPSIGVFGGAGGTGWEIFFGGQAGAEGFVGADPGVRTPLRLVLGTRFGVGPVLLRLQVRGGADLAYEARAVYRGELLLAVGLRLPWFQETTTLPSTPTDSISTDTTSP